MIWRLFGLRCALRSLGALMPWQPRTFLDIIYKTDAARQRRKRGSTG